MTGLRILIMTSLAFGLLVEHALPYLHGRRLFGVAVPAEVRYGTQGAELIRRYQLQLLPWTVISLAAASFLPLGWAALWLDAAIVITAIATMRAYARAYEGARRYAVPDAGIRNAALSDPGVDTRRVAVHFLPPLIIPAAVALYLRARWDDIPPRFAVHWTMSGVPNGWSYKTAAGVYGPLLFAGLIVVFLAGLCLSILLGSRRKPATAVLVLVMTATAYLIAAGFSLAGVLPLHYVPIWAVMAMPVAFVFILVGIVFQAMRTAGEPGTQEVTPDECWRGGQFYYNPEDAALFVQTRMGSSFTSNFGNRASWFVLGLVILYVTALICLAVVRWGH